MSLSPPYPQTSPLQGAGRWHHPHSDTSWYREGGKVAVEGATHVWGARLGGWWGWAWPQDRAFGQWV